MKKALGVLSLCLAAALAAGCEGGAAASQSYIMAKPSADSEVPPPAVDTQDVDIDLTVLSGMLVYSEVFNIMQSPHLYVGKTIRMSGPYYASLSEATGEYYHFVIIRDALQCCTSGLEFVWEGEHSYPEDYPADDTEVQVAGMFGTYLEDGTTYYRITVEDIEILR